MISAAYLAGFVDGEGNISALAYVGRYKRGKRAGETQFITALRVQVTNTDLAALQAIQADWGGRICSSANSKFIKNPHHRRSFVLTWQRRSEVRKVLEAIAPYVIIKRERLLYVMANWPLAYEHEIQGRHISEDELRCRVEVVRSLRVMNRRGAIEPGTELN